MAQSQPPTALDRSHSMPTGAHDGANVRRQSALQSFAFRKKSEIDIFLDGSDEFIHSYSTFDAIRGRVSIRFEKDTRIDDIHVFFEGQSNTWIEKMAAASPRTGRATARHIFLRMEQPVDANCFPADNTAKAGVTYNVPFTFVVPDRTLPFVCNHKHDNDDVKNQHLLLPPSMGDQMLAGEGSLLMNDLAPAMSKITYSIRARLAKSSLNSRHTDVIHESTRVRIIPARAELPPLPIGHACEACEKFRLRKEKNVRKGIFRIGKKQGRLTAETTQPGSLKIHHPQQRHRKPASMMMNVNLRFDPASIEEQPPLLNGITTKLKAYTFFGAGPFKALPGPHNFDVWSLLHGQYSQTIDLSTMNLSSVSWTRHEPGINVAVPTSTRKSSMATTTSSNKVEARSLSLSTTTSSSQHRRNRPQFARQLSSSSNGSVDSESDSSSAGTDNTNISAPSSPVQSTSSDPFNARVTPISPSESYNPSLPYYTTSVVLPVTLPSSATMPEAQSSPTDSTVSQPLKRKTNVPTLLPTFHSCLISRTYSLDLTLCPSGTNTPNLNLRVPIQLNLEPQQPTQSPSQSSVPIEFYDPFSLSQHDEKRVQDGTTDENADVDTANDEAIARALAQSQPQYELQSQSHLSGPSPAYTPLDSQIQTSNDPISTPNPYPQTRHLSLANPNPSSIVTQPQSQFNSSPDDTAPPEYYSPFRRSSIATATTATATATSTSGSGSGLHPAGPATRRRSSRLSALSSGIRGWSFI